uniref:Putative product n=1 Tax=Xenopsylla cheopis TaxID=163159 RepID=A0A6M2E1Q9_XENCH
MSFYDAGEAISTAIQAPLFHAAAFLLCVPLARSAAPRWGAHVRTVPLLGVALLCAGLGFSALLSVSRSAAYIGCYGLLGGAGASVVVAHVHFTINRLFAGYPGLVQGLCDAGQAAGQFAMPHLTLTAVQSCGQRGAHAVLTGVMMNMVAAILLMTLKDKKRDSLQSDIRSNSEPENTSYPTISNTNSTEGKLVERCWRCPSDGSNLQPLSPPLIRRSSCGVDILQSIPEESEESDSEDYYETNATTITPLRNGQNAPSACGT